ncbi:hypothetical protein AB4305_16400 [Nocardia sp. 2YAB30]|uniref:hypothetical protein n=1 Tax=unclassified Nocardia TaxID=2637762 RepID=UPI003F949AA9
MIDLGGHQLADLGALDDVARRRSDLDLYRDFLIRRTETTCAFPRTSPGRTCRVKYTLGTR